MPPEPCRLVGVLDHHSLVPPRLSYRSVGALVTVPVHLDGQGGFEVLVPPPDVPDGDRLARYPELSALWLEALAAGGALETAALATVPDPMQPLRESIAADPMAAEVLEGREAPATDAFPHVVVDLRPPDAYEREPEAIDWLQGHIVAFPVQPMAPTGITRLGRLRLPSRSCGQRFEYGWGRESQTSPCLEVDGLPRACMMQQSLAGPSQADHALQLAIDALLLRDGAARLALWTLAFTEEQVEGILAYLASGCVLDRLRGLLFARARDRRPKLTTGREVQRRLHALWKRDPEAPPVGPGFNDDAELVDAVMNGSAPGLLEHQPDGVAVTFETHRFDFGGPCAVLPDVRVEMAQEGEWLSLTAISTRDGARGVWRREVAGPATDGPWSGWGHARRVASMALLLHGQYRWHVARGHLIAELVQIALSRTLPCRHPVRVLLEPHVRGAIEINNFGHGLVVEELGALVRCTALSSRGSADLLADSLGRLDWKTFRPRASIGPRHRFAQLQRTFWDHLMLYVKGELARMQLGDQEWRQLTDFGVELAHHSAPCSVSTAWRKRFKDDAELPAPRTAPGRYRRSQEKYGRSLHPLPDGQDQGALAQLCAWIIHHASFVHTWANDRQLIDGGDLRRGPLGLRAVGSPGSEADYWKRFAPPASEVALQLLVIEQLVRTRWLHLVPTGIVGRFERRFVPQRLTDHFSSPAFAARMEALGLPVSRIRMSANV